MRFRARQPSLCFGQAFAFTRRVGASEHRGREGPSRQPALWHVLPDEHGVLVQRVEFMQLRLRL
eukprot:2046642-Alexandrium_andersonii.AAC.1